MAIGLAGFASMASMRACDSVLPALASGFSATTSAAAQTISGFAIAYGVMQFFLGPLGDRLGKPRVIGWAVMACACANVGIALSDSLDAIIAGRVLAGAAGGGIVPLSLAHIGDTVTYERRQVALSRLLLATISGMVAGQWLGGVIAQDGDGNGFSRCWRCCLARRAWPCFGRAVNCGVLQRVQRGRHR